jgi:flagellar biosynthetic protein FliP
MATDIWAADQGPNLGITIEPRSGDRTQIATAMQILLALTLISLAPAFLIAVTSFTRIIIVLSMLRQALGMQETPPNTVLVTLALFLSLFTMLPIFEGINKNALQPYLEGKLDLNQAYEQGITPLREFMIRQTREGDLALMVDISRTPPPQNVEEVSTIQLVPAFMLSELRSAFQIGFVIYLPFLLIDLVISSALMAMGMFMVPPIVMSLPIKVMMFVLIDGWSLVARSLVSSFH